MKKNKLSLVFLGTPEFSVPSLKALRDVSSFELKGVVTQPDRKQGRGQELQPPAVKRFCLENKIPCYQFETLNSPEGLECLKKMNADIAVVISFGQILSQEVLDLPPHGFINAHASLLPKLRGAAPINWAIINGDKETGVSIMKLVKKMDAGPVLLKEKTHITSNETAETLYKKLSLISAKLLIKALEQISTDSAVFSEQNHAHATYAPLIQKEDCKIDWNNTAQSIHDFIRGMSPQPGAFTVLNGDRLKIYATKISQQSATGAAGTILESGDTSILVNTQNYGLFLTDLQLANKKRLSASQFTQGHTLKKGTLLG